MVKPPFLPVEIVKNVQEGWSVFPCHAKTTDTYKVKAPITGWGGKMRGSRDLAQLRRWAKQYPGCMWGGTPPEGIWVMDVDPRNGGDATLKALLQGAKMPVTPYATTAGGGWHYVFNSQAPAGSLGKGIDIKRGGKGYVILAPSFNQDTGTAYAWRRPPWVCKPARAPEALLQGAQGHTEGQQSGVGDFGKLGRDWSKQLATEVRTALKQTDPDMDYHQWIEVGQALHSADPSITGQAFETWDKWSQRGDKYEEGDCEKHWKTFKKTGGITISTLFGIAKEHGVDPKKLKNKVKQWENKKKSRDTTPAVQARTYDLGSVADTNGYEPRVFINDMLAEGCCLLVGPMKMGKTFMAMQLAAMLNTGKPLWDNDIEKPVKVALLALEEGGQAEAAEDDPVHRMRKRVRDMKLVEDLRGVNLVLHLEPRDDGGVGHVRELFAEHDVLIIDSLAKIEQINDAEEGGIWKADYAIIEKFRKVATELHKCLVIITHTAKDSNQRDAMAAIAGTGGKLAAADGMWILQRPDKDDPDRIRLTTYGRDVSSDDYEMRWVGEQRWWHCLGPWVNLTVQQQDVLNWLIESGNDWSTREAIAEGLGVTRDTSALWFLLNKLVGKKLINQRTLPGHEGGAGRPPMQYRASSVAIRRDRLLRTLETAHVARVNVVDPFEI